MLLRKSTKKLRSTSIFYRFLCLVGVGSLCSVKLLATSVSAQVNVIPDETLGTEQSVVMPDGEGVDIITGGATRGSNLFHSFEEFGIDQSAAALFLLDSNDVANVFSRVTGELPSNILGTLGTGVLQDSALVPSDANFYLINPNGVLFGEGATLFIGGSFSATSASSLSFDEAGLFSAIAPQSPSELLTINPSAYLFEGTNAGDISSLSTQPFSTELAVSDGQSITLLGGNLALAGSSSEPFRLRSFGGRINLGAVAGTGSVGITADGGLSFANDTPRGDAYFANSFFSTLASNDNMSRVGDDINITARNIISDGSAFLVGTFLNQGTAQDTAGSLMLNATESIQINGSVLASGSASASRGGDIDIRGRSLQINNSELLGSAENQAISGNILLAVPENILVSNSNLGTEMREGAQSGGGNVAIQAGSLSMIGNSRISSDTFGSANTGSITLTVEDAAVIQGDINGIGDLSTQVFPGASGNGGKVEIVADFLRLTDGSAVRASTAGEGNSGNVTIDTRSSTVIDAGQIASNANAVFSSGNGGNINIRSGSFRSINNSELRAETNTRGNAGNIDITTDDEIVVIGGIIAGGVGSSGIGQGGNISLTGESINIRDGAQVTSATYGQGNAGDITLLAENAVVLADSVNGIWTNVNTAIAVDAIGNAGDITISGNSLEVTDGASINASIFGRGDGGNIIIDVEEAVTFSGSTPPIATETLGPVPSDFPFSTVRVNSIATSAVSFFGEGKGGNINISAGSLNVLDGSSIFTNTVGQGDSGDILISVEDDLLLTGIGDLGTSTIFTASGTPQRAGGDIEISASRIRLIGEASDRVGPDLAASSTDGGIAGNIRIFATEELYLSNGQIEAVSQQRSGGNVTVDSDRILLEGAIGGNITTQVFSGEGTGGNITLNADSYIVALDDTDILASSPDGTGGNIAFQTPAFFGENIVINDRSAGSLTNVFNNRVDVNATGQVDGSVSTPDVSFVENELSELTETLVDPDTLVASSCIVRSDQASGAFAITGREGLTQGPDSSVFHSYSLSNIENTQAVAGTVVDEPQAAYRLNDGRLVLSQFCSE